MKCFCPLPQNDQGHFPQVPHTLLLRSGSLWAVEWVAKQWKSSKLGKSGWKCVKASVMQLMEKKGEEVVGHSPTLDTTENAQRDISTYLGVHEKNECVPVCAYACLNCSDLGAEL